MRKQKTSIDWNRYTRGEERREIQRMKTDEAHMLMSGSYNNDDEVYMMVEENEYVYLESYASKHLFILHDQSCLQSFVYSGGSIQTTCPVKLC